MKRISPWNNAKRNAPLGEFRRLLGGHRAEQVQNAIRAGRSLGQLMIDATILITGIDDVQLERYRRRYAVPPSLKTVMYAVATGMAGNDILDAVRFDDETGEEIRIAVKRTYPKPSMQMRGVEIPRKWGTESPQAKKLMKLQTKAA
jgi:hypothetical protein